jgi:hypothetical protein
MKVRDTAGLALRRFIFLAKVCDSWLNSSDFPYIEVDRIYIMNSRIDLLFTYSGG